MEANTDNSKRYSKAYHYAFDLLSSTYPNWGAAKLDVAANLYVSILLAVADVTEIQEQGTGICS